MYLKYRPSKEGGDPERERRLKKEMRVWMKKGKRNFLDE